MKYKQTFDLIDEIISKNIDDVKIKNHKYDSPLLLPYRQKECTELTYFLKTSNSYLSVDFNDRFLEMVVAKPEGLVLHITYKIEDGEYVLDRGRTRLCNKIVSVNKNYLIPELEAITKGDKNGMV